jgi:hypothetical protein
MFEGLGSGCWFGAALAYMRAAFDPGLPMVNRSPFFLSCSKGRPEMEQKKLLTWLLGIFFVGILCIFSLGRPSSSQSAPVTASYTPPPSHKPSGSELAAELQSVAAQNVAAVPSSTGGDAIGSSSEISSVDGGSVITTMPSATFETSSVVNLPLKEGIAKIAQAVPGATIRPIPQGTSAPPGTYDSKRFSVFYDPNTLTITQVVVG